jgi:hypothetical protein
LLLHLRISSKVWWSRPRPGLVLLASVWLLDPALWRLLASVDRLLVGWGRVATVLVLVLPTVDRYVKLVVDHVNGAVVPVLR